MPAIPIAESSPPIVVGARQTKSATSTVMVTGTPAPAVSTLYREKVYSVAHMTIKTEVSPMRRMLSAISFGVFCRLRLQSGRSCGRGTLRRGSRSPVRSASRRGSPFPR